MKNEIVLFTDGDVNGELNETSVGFPTKVQDGEKRLSDGMLVAITLMIAESKAEEKDVMVKLIMNLLKL